MKMSLETLDRVIASATAKEIDFLIYVMRFQDEMGVIRGIERDDVCSAVKIHKSKFYVILNSLENKGIIRIFWNKKIKGFWTILVIGNSFVCKEDYKKGYLNLNTKFLRSEQFLSLKKCEKVICIKILSVYRETRKNISLKFETIASWAGVSVKYVKRYFDAVSAVFKGLTIKGGLIVVDLKTSFDAFSRNVDSEKETLYRHLLNYVISSKKLKNEQPDRVNDTVKIFMFFSGKYGINSVITAVIACIDNLGIILPQYINKMTRIVGKNKNSVRLIY